MNAKVKIVAIAKDEAAYLPEWIYHHLYFGFDSIDIYVNNTSDNTATLKKQFFEKLPVNFLDGDVFFNSNNLHPQQDAYQHGLNQARKDGFSHVLFLDIDEFWTPSNFSSDIKTCIENINADVISFEWVNKIESEEFSPAFSQRMAGEHHRLVKSLFSTAIDIQKLDIHNIKSENATYALADGKAVNFNDKKQKLSSISKEIKEFFILHRMFRSQLEYVSLLGRGRPTSSRLATNFKNNRNGFCVVDYDIKEIELPQLALEKYNESKIAFFKKYICQNTLKDSIDFVKERFNQVNSMIVNASIRDLSTISKILTDVDNPLVVKSFAAYLNNICRYLENNAVDLMRDGAMALESKNLGKALRLMEIAHILRPKGGIIKSKLQDYKNKLQRQNNG